jgi:hypothetical protein
MTEAGIRLIPNHLKMEYELDPFEIIRALELKFNSNYIHFQIYEVQDATNEWVKFPGYDIDTIEYQIEQIPDRLPNTTAVITISHSLFVEFLSRKIMVLDVHRIGGMLSYQLELSGFDKPSQRNEFIDLIEFQVYPVLVKQDYLNEFQRIQNVQNWVELNRFQISTQRRFNSSNEKSATNTNPYKIEHNLFRFKPDFSEHLINEFKHFFEESEHDNLKQAILTDCSNSRLKFQGSNKQLGEFFHRLKNSKHMLGKTTYETLATFLAKHFEFSLGNNIFKPVKDASILSVMKNPNIQPQGDDRILPDFC